MIAAREKAGAGGGDTAEAVESALRAVEVAVHEAVVARAGAGPSELRDIVADVTSRPPSPPAATAHQGTHTRQCCPARVSVCRG